MSATRNSALGVGLALLGVYHLALAAYMTLAPASFFERIGPFGTLNEHYIRDFATFSAALGIVALVAFRRVGWRVPVLAFAAAQYLLHTVNHIVDVDVADPRSVGVADAVSLAVVTVVLVGGLRTAWRSR